jgi:hypothetical protein
MLTILSFYFMYHKIQLYFKCHVRYTHHLHHLHVIKDF